MPFPMRFAGKKVATPRDLGALFVADARAGGGTVYPGKPPHVWVAEVVKNGRLETEVAVALVALVLASGDAAAVAEAARLATLLPRDRLATLFPAAVDGQDMGVLLTPDPYAPGRSVEDALLLAWAAVTADEPATRPALLDRLRNAGLPDVEASLVARLGTPAEIRAILPLVFIEGVPPGTAEALTPLLTREPAAIEALRAALESLPSATIAEIGRRNPALTGR